MSSKINSAPASTHNEEVQKFANYMYKQFVKNKDLFTCTVHEGAGGFKYTSANLKPEFNFIFKPLIDSRSVVYGYELTPQAKEALTCIVGDRWQTLIYILFRFMYSTESEEIEQECIKLYKAFIIYHGDDKTTLQKLMNTPNKDASLSTPLIGFMWEHGGKANEALVRKLFEAFGVPTWEHKNLYGESPKSLWEQTHKRKPIELYNDRCAQAIYELAVKYGLFTSTPKSLFTSTPKSLFTPNGRLEDEWDRVFIIWSCDTHHRWEFNLTQDVISALGCIVGDTKFNLAYILLTCIPYSTENKDIEEQHIKLYKALLDRNCIREVLSQNPNELECRSTILIRMITQYININTDFVISLIKTIGADAWTHQNSDGGKSAESLWNDNHDKPIKL